MEKLESLETAKKSESDDLNERLKKLEAQFDSAVKEKDTVSYCKVSGIKVAQNLYRII